MVPSITNIIDRKNKPGLKHWAAKAAAEYAADNLAKLEPLNRDERIQLVKNAPFTRTADSAAATGDAVHSWIDNYVKTGGTWAPDLPRTSITAQHMWHQFLAFVGRYQPTFGLSEFTVWSERYGYAGTGDLAFNVGGQNVLCDTKTGKNVYPEVAMQLAALAHADCIIDPEGNEHLLPGFDKYTVLHLRPMSFTLIPVERTDEAFQAFLALKTVLDWEASHADKTLGYAPKVAAAA
jgi:hypothetical protein